MKYIFVVAIAIGFGILTSVSRAEPVELTDTTGQFKIRCEIIEVVGSTVRVKREDGEIIAVPLKTLHRDSLTKIILQLSQQIPKLPPWRELFNGKDLNGWEANVRPESFTVEDGILKCHGKNGMSHLFFVGNSGQDIAFKYFELAAVVRSEPNSNSGIFFHTSRELRSGKYLNKGYEVQLNSSKVEKRKTGSLYGVLDLNKSPVDETEWFEIRLRVEGNRIQIFVGDEQVLDYTEPPTPIREPGRAKRLLDPAGGAIALQAHDPNSIFYFRQIRIRELK